MRRVFAIDRRPSPRSKQGYIVIIEEERRFPRKTYTKVVVVVANIVSVCLVVLIVAVVVFAVGVEAPFELIFFLVSRTEKKRWG